MSKVQAFYHIVISTYCRKCAFPIDQMEPLFRFITKILKDNDCVMHRINGMQDHIHMLIELNPNIALAELMRTIKKESSQWITRTHIYPDFDGWCEGYGAFSCSYSVKDKVAKYIINQQEHHRQKSFEMEIEEMFRLANLQLHPNDFM